MQRIAIARAIFSESPILILDEATSSLDAATEKELLENLRQMTNKTVIIVTHRPAALKKSACKPKTKQKAHILNAPKRCMKTGKPLHFML